MKNVASIAQLFLHDRFRLDSKNRVWKKIGRKDRFEIPSRFRFFILYKSGKKLDRRRFNKQVKWKEQDVTHTQANFGEALLTLVASNIFVIRMCLIDIEIYTTYLLCTANFARPVNLSNDYLSSRDLATLTHSSLIVLLSLERSIYLFSFRSKEPKFQSISKLTRSKNNWLETQQDRKLSKIPLISTLQFNKRKDFTNEESVSIFRSKKK